MSVTLDISKIWARDLDAEELKVLEKSFEGLATVELKGGRTIISLIGNANRSAMAPSPLLPLSSNPLPSHFC